MASRDDVLPEGEGLQRWYRLVHQSHARRLARVSRDYNERLDWYRGRHWDHTDKPDWLQRVTSNYVGDGIHVKLASLTYAPPTFHVSTPDSGDAEVESLIATVLKEDMLTSGAWNAVQAAWLDSLIFGLGALTVGWRAGVPDYGADPQGRTPEDVDAEMELWQRSAEMAQYFAAMGMPEAAPEPTVVEPVPLVGEGQWAARVSPYNLLIDPQVDWSNWQQARWIGRIYSLSVEELDSLPGLRRKRELVQIAGPVSNEDPFERERADLSGEDRRVPLYEVWFRGLRRPGAPARNLLVVWCPWTPDKPVVLREWPFTLRDSARRPLYPFVVVPAARVLPGSLQSQGDVELAQEQQREYNQMRSLQLTQMWGSRDVMIALGQLDEETADQLRDPRHHKVIETSVPLSTLALRGADPQLYRDTDQSVRDITAHTGVSEAARGLDVPQAQTATEIQYIAGQSSARAAGEQRLFESVCELTATLLWELRREMGAYGGTYLGMAQGQPQRMELLEQHLQRVVVSLSTGSTKLRDTQAEIRGILQFLDVAGRTGTLWSPANPAGSVNPQVLIRALASILDLPDQEELFDVSGLQGQVPAMMPPAAPSPGGLETEAMPMPAEPGASDPLALLLSTAGQGG